MSASSTGPASIPSPARCWSRATASSRSRAAARASRPTGSGATVIDGMGATLMPGMIDAHLHLSWNNAPGIDPINMMELEEHMLVTMEMAKTGPRRRLHRRARRRGRQAAARRGRQALHQRGPLPRPALSRRRAGDHHGRRPRRYRAVAHPASRPESRPRRLRTGGGAAHGAHADQVRRRLRSS